MKKIFVNVKDLGFLTQESITVQRFDPPIDEGEDPELVYCNHAGAEEEEVENSIINVDGQDTVWYTKVLVCDKCEAYKPEHEEAWEDAPIEGVR